MEKAITTYLALTEGYIQEVASDLFFSLLFLNVGNALSIIVHCIDTLPAARRRTC